MADSPSTPQIIEHLRDGTPFTTYFTKWVPRSSRMVVGGMKPRGTGIIRIYKLGFDDVHAAAQGGANDGTGSENQNKDGKKKNKKEGTLG